MDRRAQRKQRAEVQGLLAPLKKRVAELEERIVAEETRVKELNERLLEASTQGEGAMVSNCSKEIHDLGMLAGVALNPDTSLKDLHANVLKVVDMVLLMTVFPGFGGQQFIAAVLPKITALRDMMPKLNIEVDGGITDKTARFAVEAGANVLVSGSFVFGAKDRRKVLESLKKN